jgi:DNA transformation protein
LPVTDSFRDFVLEQLESCRRDIHARRMFGGIGLYAGELFFALIDDDTLYFKVDDATRPKFVKKRMKPFRPYGEQGGASMNYYQLPVAVLEDAESLASWVADAVAVAQRATTSVRRPRKRRKAP